MTEKLTTGLCVLALLLSLFAAWKQETAYQEGLKAPKQPAPFSIILGTN